MFRTIPCEVLQRVLNESILVHNPDEAVFSLVPVTQLEDTIPFYYTETDGSRVFDVPATETTVFYLYDICNKTECDKLAIKYAKAIEDKINGAYDSTGTKLTGKNLRIKTYGMYKKCTIHPCRGCCCGTKEALQDGVGNHGVDWTNVATNVVSTAYNMLK